MYFLQKIQTRLPLISTDKNYEGTKVIPFGKKSFSSIWNFYLHFRVPFSAATQWPIRLPDSARNATRDVR